MEEIKAEREADDPQLARSGLFISICTHMHTSVGTYLTYKCTHSREQREKEKNNTYIAGAMAYREQNQLDITKHAALRSFGCNRSLRNVQACWPFLNVQLHPNE